MTNKPELKLCPFCGRDAFVVKECDSEERYVTYSVYCNNTNCEIVTPKFCTKEDVIAYWNKRVTAND